MDQNQTSENQADVSNKDVISTLKKKNWSSYIKEFFMLFLAVFCGFLAENYRESLSVKKIEKEYINSLIEDLKTDTTNLQYYSSFRLNKSVLMDSLSVLLLSEDRKQYGNQIYFFARQVFDGTPFVYSDGTILQLKNAGNLRLISNRKVVNELLKYEKKVRELEEWDETDMETRITFRELGGTVFETMAMKNTMDSKMKFVMPTDNPQLITDDKQVINQMAFQVHYLSKMTLGNSLRSQALKSNASSLLKLIQTEYGLN
ncbi:hypothetical protein [Algoriphagus sp.]|uniref:hypothetical protein n=1 Tax=Algoriphagus sp. TaxID=1872435 RepID=UPI0025F2FF40|nr:hypothetical protein [Algoriphagus sp.]